MAGPAFTSNMAEFLKGLKAEPLILQRKFGEKVRDIIYVLHHNITALTPVWQGQTLANYQWSMGAPTVGMVDYDASGEPGHTNEMPLGVEPRRPGNQAIADASLERLSFQDPYQSYYLNNNCPTVGPLEDGEWPSFPFNQRSPNGMFAISLTYVVSLLETGAL